ncbi:hypothetical protein ACVNF4_06515 [Streptomyces sp. S6]
MTHPQYPQQPYGQPPFQPQPPKKSPLGKILGFGCLGVIGLFVLIGIAVAAFGGAASSDNSGTSDVSESKPSATTGGAGKPAAQDAKEDTGKDDDKKADTVTFKVWGDAPAGSLGSLDITYGSDSDTRKGTFKNGAFEATLPISKDALYFHVMAQLQGSGDINCSVTVNGKTKKAHAAGGYNICNAQASSNFTGGWE